MRPPRSDPTARRRTLRVAAAIRRELAEQARSAWPKEACGLLVGGACESGAFVERAFEARNLDRAEVGARYTIDPADHLAAWRWAGERGLTIVGFWHSHPDRPAVPSERDRAAAWKGYSYLIVSVTERAVGELRCWRLIEGSFEEEALSR